MTDKKDSEEEKAAREWLSARDEEARSDTYDYISGAWEEHWIPKTASPEKAFLAGIEWDRKRIKADSQKAIQLFMERMQKTLDEIKEKNKPFTMSGIIERESIFYEIKRALIQLAIEVE